MGGQDRRGGGGRSVAAARAGHPQSMSSPQVWLGKKAAKATVKHTVHGVGSKVTRTPVRSSTLLTAGALLGAGVGFLLGRRTAKPATGADPVAHPAPPVVPATPSYPTAASDPAAPVNQA